jgi:hypothetical protein
MKPLSSSSFLEVSKLFSLGPPNLSSIASFDQIFLSIDYSFGRNGIYHINFKSTANSVGNIAMEDLIIDL